MGFFRPEYWSALPFPPPGDLPNPRIERRPPALQADSLPSEPPGEITRHLLKNRINDFKVRQKQKSTVSLYRNRQSWKKGNSNDDRT